MVQMSCAPALVKISLARLISSEFSVWTESRSIAGLDLAFIAFGFEFRNAQADQPAGDTAGGRSDGRPTERGHNRSRRDERADSGNGQGADPDNPAQRPADDAAGARARDRAFRSFRVLLVGEIAAWSPCRETARRCRCWRSSPP